MKNKIKNIFINSGKITKKNWLGFLSLVLLFTLFFAVDAFGMRSAITRSDDKVITKETSQKEVFRIVQAAEVLPRILQATIEPRAVKVGDIQKLEVILQGPNKITSVEAHIETDSRIRILPLEFIGEVSSRELAPLAYGLDKDNKLVMLDENNKNLAIKTAEAEGVKLKYAGEWEVMDVHAKKYHTTFVAKDDQGNENSVTLAWTDPCGIPNSGDWNLHNFGDCTLTQLDGVDIGNATIQSYTLTLSGGIANGIFVFSPLYSITVTTGGAIAIGESGGISGEIRKGYTFKQDGDGDGYPYPQVAFSTSASMAGWSRKSNFANGPDDCNDGNGNVFPGQTQFFSTADNVVGYDYNCDGVAEKQYSVIYGLSCSAYPNCSNIGNSSGWDSSVPECGQQGNYSSYSCSQFFSSCTTMGSTVEQAQNCR